MKVLPESETFHSFKHISKIELLSTVSKNNVYYKKMVPLVNRHHI